MTTTYYNAIERQEDELAANRTGAEEERLLALLAHTGRFWHKRVYVVISYTQDKLTSTHIPHIFFFCLISAKKRE